MGLVIGTDRADHAGAHAFPQALAIAQAAQRRTDVAEAVVVADIDVGEVQLVGSDIGRDRQAGVLRGAHQGHGPGAGEAAEVGAHPGLLDQEQIARQGHGLGGLRDPGQPEAGSDRPLVQAAAPEPGVLGVQEHREPSGRGVLERPAQDLGIGDGAHRIAHPHAADRLQVEHLGELAAREPGGQGPEAHDLRVSALFGAPVDQLRDRGRVDDRKGVRRAAQRGDPGACRGAGLAQDGGLVLAARLAQARAQVHEPRAHEETPGIDLAYLAIAESRWRRVHREHSAGGEIEIGDAIEPPCRIDDPSATDVPAHLSRPASTWAAGSWAGSPWPWT